MSKRIAVTLSTLLLAGCVKEISSEERLDRDTNWDQALDSSTVAELAKLRCDDLAAELTRARDDSAPEDKRIIAYTDLHRQIGERATKFEGALSRNPDLAYREGSQHIVSARESCVQAAADLRLDFESLVREIVNIPVVEEFREGRPTKAARLSFTMLRGALDLLDLPDKEALLARLANAERTVEIHEPKRKKEKADK